MTLGKRKAAAIAAICLALLAAGVTLACAMLVPAVAGDAAVVLLIDGDDTRDSVSARLGTLLKPLPAWGVSLAGNMAGMPVRTGRYVLTGDDSALDVFYKLRGGLQQPVDLVVPSVRTSGQLAERLASQLMLDSASIARALGDSAVCARHGFTRQTMPAMFIPDTYEVYWDTGVDRLLSRMHREYDAFWNERRRAKAEALGMTPLEVSILASIVDEETAIDDEKPTVAGLYVNRLRRGMPLQADPTVKYAVGDFGLQRILHKHLQVDSPYNTYLHPGLPPGPIRVPSVAGIDAVLDCERHDYLYMCAKEDFSGRHNFASTLARHNANAARYRRALDRRGIR